VADGEQTASATDPPVTDRELLGRLARGDRQALAPLMERHQRRLYRIAYAYLRDPEDALDAVQETFVKVFQSAARWDGLSDAGPWMSRIAVNQSIDRYRRRKLRRATHAPLEEGDHDQRVAAPAPSPERAAIGRDLGDRIQAALRGLPERQRKVFVLRHYEDMSLEDIASTLDLRLGTVKSTLHRAIQGLRERLSGLQGA
jgi:RNA polymerase sigma-70 factor (ECF subfamily)